MNNEKLQNDLNNLNIEYNKINFRTNIIEEENSSMKNQRINYENDIDILRANNTMLLNSKKDLKKNLQIFIDENKQCAEVIHKLKEEIDILNYQKNELLQKINANKNTYQINSNN